MIVVNVRSLKQNSLVFFFVFVFFFNHKNKLDVDIAILGCVFSICFLLSLSQVVAAILV